MLQPDNLEVESGEQFRARVSCAKTIIDQLIQELSENEASGRTSTEDKGPARAREANNANAPSKVLPERAEGEYKVIVDAGKLVRIEGLELDAMVEINGKRMTHAQAIGKEFQNGKIL